jgi:hypothetical protein
LLLLLLATGWRCVEAFQLFWVLRWMWSFLSSWKAQMSHQGYFNTFSGGWSFYFWSATLSKWRCHPFSSESSRDS